MSGFFIYKSTAEVKKLSADSADADKEGYIPFIATCKISIQPAGMEYVAADPEGSMGKLFQGYTTASGIRNGMLVVTSGTLTVSGMRYQMIGAQEFSGPLGRTCELLLRVAVN
jgi:hypothetical protein